MDKHVFYLEDNDINFQVAEAMLELLGINKVTRFNSIAEINDFVQTKSSEAADLLLLDIMLPDGNSLSILPEMKKHFSCPIVAFTAKSRPQEIDALKDAGFIDVFVKPIDFSCFEEKVLTLL
ncbi:MAG: response regulator [Pseudomonadota bacterium]|jgi:CheY-like chemotaxis protein|nr:response regulator [Pseudomonadota bacterium]MEC8416188.1 response regulator [Pseudomonadota bacterium]